VRTGEKKTHGRDRGPEWRKKSKGIRYNGGSKKWKKTKIESRGGGKKKGKKQCRDFQQKSDPTADTKGKKRRKKGAHGRTWNRRVDGWFWFTEKKEGEGWVMDRG